MTPRPRLSLRLAPLLVVAGAAACAPLPPRTKRPAPAPPVAVAEPDLAERPIPAQPAESPAPFGVWNPADSSGRDVTARFSTMPLLVPVRGVRAASIDDSFDAGRSGGRSHDAVDILARRGTPVLATVDGTILRVGTNELGGNVVWMADPERRFAFYYAHLERHARGLRAGDDVKRGTVLGYVGTTGNAPRNVPHLHFQVMRTPDPAKWWNGTPIDPVPFLIDAVPVTAPEGRRKP